jgi:hypothetical protein
MYGAGGVAHEGPTLVVESIERRWVVDNELSVPNNNQAPKMTIDD